KGATVDDPGQTGEGRFDFLGQLPSEETSPEVAASAKRKTTQSNLVPPVPRPGGTESGDADIILISHPQNKNIGRRFRLAPGQALEIGRSLEAEVPLPEVPSVSRNHARLEHQRGVVVLRDLQSTNGTAVNDRLIDRPTALKSGDRFQVGAVHFKFLHEQDVEQAYHDAIFELVIRDGLTGIFNKRKFDEEIDRECARARRYDRLLSLVFADIDHFKSVNDRHGHLAGDFVLQQASARMQRGLRVEQTLARIGGEEFGILCPETGAPAAAEVAEKLRREIAGSSFQSGAFSLGVTCSFGVAEFRPGMTGPAELCQAADAALYLSKKNGRNRVTIG
ncbi:MAG TPA: GGDEF domain-containing protein, partial [Thermoanaerobaculia bacterium]|nr:GGDEF domain-containing protein [Thermoanaerobaculia bacterium]